MQANDDNENEDGAAEGLVDLGEANRYQGAPIHREEEFLNSKLVNSEKFDQSLLWEPFGTSKAAYATLELECFINKKVNGTFQLASGGNICRVVCRGDVGRIKWNKGLKKYQPISNGNDAHICSYRAHIRKIRPKDGHHHWIIDPKHTELKHNDWCRLGTRHCASNTTVRKRILKNLDTVRAFTYRKTRGREVMSSIQVNSKVKASSVHSKRAWKEGNGANPKVFRESFTRLGHLINWLRLRGNCAATVFWSDAEAELRRLPVDQRGDDGDIKYFVRYALCARGLRDFLAKAGVPYFSFDACHSYHLYYRGVFGNVVALVDTKVDAKDPTLTNCAFALSTDDSEHGGLYNSLFDVIKDGENESPLIEVMKKKSSVLISDDNPAFQRIARQELGNDRRFATCSWHMMNNAKKAGKGWDEKTLFWPYVGARTQFERDGHWEELRRVLPAGAFASLARQKEKEENNQVSWTLLKHIDAGMCMFGRQGSNNPVEQLHAKQLKDRGQNPFKFAYAWIEGCIEMEAVIIQAAQKLKDNEAILTPWANKQYQDAANAMVRVRIGEEVIIDPAEAAMVAEEWKPNEFIHYGVNLNKRMCGCGHWQHYGIACNHAIVVWEKYQEQLAERNGERMEADAYIKARAKFAVGDQPYFLAEVFIEAANALKANRIKLPCESTYVFDVNKYPPKPLPKTRLGRPAENRFVNAPAEATTRCGICHQRGHNQVTCAYYEVWFDWNDPNDRVFGNLFTNALNPNGNRARPPR